MRIGKPQAGSAGADLRQQSVKSGALPSRRRLFGTLRLSRRRHGDLQRGQQARALPPSFFIHLLQQVHGHPVTGDEETGRQPVAVKTKPGPGLEPVTEDGVRFRVVVLSGSGQDKGVLLFLAQLGEQVLLPPGDGVQGVVQFGLLDIVRFPQFQHQPRLPEHQFGCFAFPDVGPVQEVGQDGAGRFRIVPAAQVGQGQHAQLAEVGVAAAADVPHQGEKPLPLVAQGHGGKGVQPAPFYERARGAPVGRRVFNGLHVDNLSENLYKGQQETLVGQGFRKHAGNAFVHDMSTVREKITFVLTALAYLLFHLRLGADAGAMVKGTTYQILLTAPYALGFTYIVAVVFRRMTGKGWLPWDRLFRIFFTVGILFAFFFALYEYAGQGKPMEDRKLHSDSSAARFFEDVLRQVR